mmetsp:Transcript_124267/g.218770  ORF Transcript_124267/g.218770 Transcript_124267/m.218770 type:complete len:109 (-) Transcript_124267:1135-1461(-)
MIAMCVHTLSRCSQMLRLVRRSLIPHCHSHTRREYRLSALIAAACCGASSGDESKQDQGPRAAATAAAREGAADKEKQAGVDEAGAAEGKCWPGVALPWPLLQLTSSH